jgi:hypothetical protein
VPCDLKFANRVTFHADFGEQSARAAVLLFDVTLPVEWTARDIDND